jgi:hypothetical protein
MIWLIFLVTLEILGELGFSLLLGFIAMATSEADFFNTLILCIACVLFGLLISFPGLAPQVALIIIAFKNGNKAFKQQNSTLLRSNGIFRIIIFAIYLVGNLVILPIVAVFYPTDSLNIIWLYVLLAIYVFNIVYFILLTVYSCLQYRFAQRFIKENIDYTFVGTNPNFYKDYM